MSTAAPANEFGLRAQVQDYFERQAIALISDVSSAAALTSHDPFVGAAAETAIRSFLVRHLPGRYAVSSGHVVAYNELSAQVDVIVYDAMECFSVPITPTEALFSIEGVYAALEVKSSPSRSSSSASLVKQAIENIRTVKSLRCISFSTLSRRPAFARVSDVGVLAEGLHTMFRHPTGAIILVGCRDTFPTALGHFRQHAQSYPDFEETPDLFCVIDESNFGLCGFDYQVREDPATGGKRIGKAFWEEPCDSAGDALAKFLYWLAHKVVFDQFTELPLVHENRAKGLWPSVMAPVIPRIRVDTSEDGSQWSFPWDKETRLFPSDTNPAA